MTTAAPPARQLVTGGDPDSIYPAPAEELFEEHEYREAPDLRRIANKLIDAGAISLPQGTDVTYLWKAKGGKSHDLATFGKCIKLSGLAKYFAHYMEESQFIVWLAADWAREFPLDAFQVEGLVYHELAHIGPEFDKKGDPTGNAILVGHNFEGFKGEIERYGLYMPDAKYIAPAFQGLLPLQ